MSLRRLAEGGSSPHDAMIITLPYAVDTYVEKSPYINVLLILFTIAASFYVLAAADPDAVAAPWVAEGWKTSGLFGHVFLHGDIFHLLGNMFFLWVFGNAICSKIGSVFYLLLYFFLGVAAAAAHIVFRGDGLIGASGAISGMIGMYLAIYPTNRIYWYFGVFYGFGYYSHTFRVPGFVLIALWVGDDIYGAYLKDDNISYQAHLGGYFAGFISGYLLNVAGAIKTNEASHRTMHEIISGKRKPAYRHR